MFLGLVIVLIPAILAACGDETSEPPTVTVLPPTITPTRFPPTWTPVPSPTPLPLKTLEYTYMPAPTGSPVFLPTRPPTEIPPTFDPLAATAQAAAALVQGQASSNTALLLSAVLLNEEAARMLETVTGSFIDAPPEITFEGDRVVVAMNVLVRQADGSTIARPVRLEAAANPAGNVIRLVKQTASYTDDDTPYDDPIGDFVLGSVDTALNNVLRAQYQQSNPGGGAFIVVEVQVSGDGLKVRTDAESS
jgi:hypothetical protein